MTAPGKAEPAGTPWSTAGCLLMAVIGLALIVILSLTSYQMDFRAFYVAGRAFHDGLDPYENNLGAGPAYYDPADLRSHSRFLYPPQSLPLFEPFALLGYRGAKAAFSAVSLLALLTLLWMLARRLGSTGPPWTLFLLSFPVLASFERGQVDILVVLLIFLGYANRAKWHGPLLLALAISIKLVPILLLLHFVLVEKNARFVLRTAAFTTLILLLSLSIVPPGLYLKYASRTMAGLYVSQQNVHTAPESYSFEGRQIVTPDGRFTFDHSFVHGNLNPLFGLGSGIYPFGILLLLGFQVLFLKRRLGHETAFFSSLVLIMAANHLLWIMGMVCYLPLAMALLQRRLSLKERVLVLSPLFLPKWPFVPIVNVPYNFIMAVVVVAWFTMRRPALAETPRPSIDGRTG